MNQQHWSNDLAYRYWRNAATLAAIVLVSGCATVEQLMPTPTMYVGQGAKPLFLDIPADSRKPSVDLLYITDRAPGTEAAKTLPYSADRSRSMAFGSVTVEIGEGIDWSALAAQSTVSKR
jgi:esterase/lipase superfamily enzyme